MISLHVETFKDEITSIGAIHLFQPPEHRHFIAQKEFYEELRVLGKGEHEARSPDRKHPEKAIKKFAAWLQDISDPTSVGFDVNQHLNSLKILSSRYNAQVFNPRIIIELQEVCYVVMSINASEIPKIITLDNIIEYAGLASAPSPCNSLEQARLESEVLSRLMHGKSLYKAYCQEQFPVPEYIL